MTVRWTLIEKSHISLNRVAMNIYLSIWISIIIISECILVLQLLLGVYDLWIDWSWSGGGVFIEESKIGLDPFAVIKIPPIASSAACENSSNQPEEKTSSTCNTEESELESRVCSRCDVASESCGIPSLFFIGTDRNWWNHESSQCGNDEDWTQQS